MFTTWLCYSFVRNIFYRYFMQIADVSLLPPLVCAVMNMGLGFAWFMPTSPTGKVWVREMGFTKEKMAVMEKKGAGFAYLFAFIGAFLQGYVLSHVLVFAETATLGEALQGGFWMWLGFIAPVVLGGTLWDGKSWKLFTITAGYYLISTLAMSGILYGLGR
jgi:hypothetical protein